jgi:hypothetical protein
MDAILVKAPSTQGTRSRLARAQPRAGTVDQGRFTPRPRVSSSNGRTFDSPEAQLGQASRGSNLGRIAMPTDRICRRFEIGGSLGRRVKCRCVPQPRWVGARPSAKGGERWPETSVREVEIPRPSCSSRGQVGCACSRGLQASTRERERAASRERLSRPRPRAANPL